jgi:hypothetical protein
MYDVKSKYKNPDKYIEKLKEDRDYYKRNYGEFGSGIQSRITLKFPDSNSLLKLPIDGNVTITGRATWINRTDVDSTFELKLTTLRLKEKYDSCG